MKLSAYERQAIELNIRDAEKAIAAAKTKLRRDEVNHCVHDWRDESYTNGHNGDHEEQYKCKKCGWSIGHIPRDKEHM